MIEWLPASENKQGIETVAYEPIDKYGKYHRTVGFNGILKGDEVTYQGKTYTVVMVSRLGDFGLSETGELPYSIRVFPNEVSKV